MPSLECPHCGVRLKHPGTALPPKVICPKCKQPFNPNESAKTEPEPPKKQPPPTTSAKKEDVVDDDFDVVDDEGDERPNRKSDRNQSKEEVRPSARKNREDDEDDEDQTSRRKRTKARDEEDEDQDDDRPETRKKRGSRQDEDDEDDDRNQKKKRSRDEDDDTSKKRGKDEEEEEDTRKKRGKDQDEEEDDRGTQETRKRGSRDEDEDDEDSPRGRRNRRNQEEDEDSATPFEPEPDQLRKTVLGLKLVSYGYWLQVGAFGVLLLLTLFSLLRIDFVGSVRFLVAVAGIPSSALAIAGSVFLLLGFKRRNLGPLVIALLATASLFFLALIYTVFLAEGKSIATLLVVRGAKGTTLWEATATLFFHAQLTLIAGLFDVVLVLGMLCELGRFVLGMLVLKEYATIRRDKQLASRPQTYAIIFGGTFVLSLALLFLLRSISADSSGALGALAIVVLAFATYTTIYVLSALLTGKLYSAMEGKLPKRKNQSRKPEKKKAKSNRDDEDDDEPRKPEKKKAKSSRDEDDDDE